MAVLKKGSKDIILRELTGKLGDVIIRQCNGKAVFAALPKKRIIHKPLVMRQMNKFGKASLLSGFLLKIASIKKVWEHAKINAEGAQRKIMKCNLNAATPDGLTTGNIITPPPFDFLIRDVVIYEENISVIMSDWFEPDQNDKLIMIMALTEPKSKESKSFHLVDLSPENAEDFEIVLSEEQMKQFLRYKSFIIYVAVIRHGSDSPKWSNTFTISGTMV